MSAADFLSAASRLCAACGMCCDGTLFHSVVLQEGDSARALGALGLKIKHRGGTPHFLQPCAAHQSARCTIYDQRPARCRLFHCRQLQRLSAGETTEAAALEKIQPARRRVDHVDTLIRRLAETNPHRALAQRCANALTTAEQTPTHHELAAAMQDLETLLAADFRAP